MQSEDENEEEDQKVPEPQDIDPEEAKRKVWEVRERLGPVDFIKHTMPADNIKREFREEVTLEYKGNLTYVGEWDENN